ncbi:MAG: hypothetical protein ACREJO_05540 [Phycisphaerales bacterium]
MALLVVFVAGSLFMGARGIGVAVIAVATGVFWWVTGMFDILEGQMLPPWVWALKYGRNFCQKCGYDLKGQEMKRCPECGKRFRRVIGSDRGAPMDRRRDKGRSDQKPE